ncbi:MAG: ester cyclase [Actinobacteria bacterium]|nr:ester cyclase [Actinomycetota bacterium]
MAEDQNKNIARRLWETFQSGDLDDIDSFVAADAVLHSTQDPYAHLRGPERVKKVIEMYRAAFSNLGFTIRMQLAEGDCVCTLLETSGDNTGEFMGMPASGRHGSVLLTQVDRIVDGKIAESWSTWDSLSLLQQLGMAPAGAHPATT